MPEGQRQAVRQYKRILLRALERCPAGTRSRIARETGISKSFVSQIFNPSYDVPLPSKYVETVVGICDMNTDEAAAFQETYAIAHPLVNGSKTGESEHELRIPLPKFKSMAQRQKTVAAIQEAAQAIINLAVK